MKRRYLRLVRRVYRSLRHPHIKRISFLDPLIKAIFNRRYWRPCRATVANGLSVGLFCAMLPIPFQMLLAALGCLRFRGNVPIAAAACWLTNPLTQIPVMLAHERFGAWLHTYHVPRAPLLDKLEGPIHIKIFGTTLINTGDLVLNAGSYITGMLASAILLAILAYPLVYGISYCIPHRHRQPKPPRADDFEI